MTYFEMALVYFIVVGLYVCVREAKIIITSVEVVAAERGELNSTLTTIVIILVFTVVLATWPYLVLHKTFQDNQSEAGS